MLRTLLPRVSASRKHFVRRGESFLKSHPHHLQHSQLNLHGKRTFLNLPFGDDKVQSHKVSKVLRCSPRQIYDVVSNVTSYKDFVPFVEESYIKEQDSNSAVAGLRVGWKQFDEQFECKLNLDPHKTVIAESLTISLFSELYTEWNFKQRKSLHGETCTVELLLKYKFKNPVYNAISSMFSEQVTSIMIKAFEARVQHLKYQVENK